MPRGCQVSEQEFKVKSSSSDVDLWSHRWKGRDSDLSWVEALPGEWEGGRRLGI